MENTKLKRELIVATISVMIAFITIVSSTYAWFVSNTAVQATTSTISAKANSFVLQIATKDQGTQHSSNNQSLVANTEGHKISPSSTNDAKTWYICQGWGQDGNVHSYQIPADLDENGKYTVDQEHYAFIKSE